MEMETKESAARKSCINPKPGIVQCQTQYMGVLLQAEQIPLSHNMLTGFFTWILLAGYLVLPGTFTTLQKSAITESGGETGFAKEIVARAIQNPPLIGVGTTCCVVGAIGMVWLWARWHGVITWVINRLIMPSLLNSFIGLINTIINVYTAKDGHWSVMAIVTATATALLTVAMLASLILYNFFLLRQIREDHEAQVNAMS
ncbi:hypothetical protein AJ80_09496 [Polytolypa hystricis UAMH7299]|uniref:Uncharacterized protein n=1 Tax=Polytolypa hystricis (strain UAMH7299) TaxID=1447883 RepID=A0A2B7WQ24_POLH7|nr:hypothetical protein AJ80_09496 [Polytolypa hystricis UAMH7299]